MKKLFIFIFIMATLSACGKSNKVNSNIPVSGSEGLSGSAINFEGTYDLVRMDTPDCGASIRILQQCGGYILSKNNFDRAEEFCNVNRGESRLNDRNPTRRPPDQIIDQSQESLIVTQAGNVLKSTHRINANIVFTNTLTLDSNGILTKISNLKSRNERCFYQKR